MNTRRLEFLDTPDEVLRRQAVEDAVKKLDESTAGSIVTSPTLSEVKARYAVSCWIVLLASITGTVLLGLSSAYFTSLPRPYSYISTQDGKLYEIKPYKIEK